jgi:YfiH family protein
MMVGVTPQLLRPGWPAPRGVRACCTTRIGGASAVPFNGLNLATHVGDDPLNVAYNRALLREHLALANEPAWLRQVHGIHVVQLPASDAEPEADASWTTEPGNVCAVLTADCLPVLLCDEDARCVAAAHAGWRGLASGVLESTVNALPVLPTQLMAWLGPAIGPLHFEVGPEVFERFVDQDPAAAEAFVPSEHPGRLMADLYELARLRLRRLGVTRIYGGDHSTVAEPEQFYSYRREAVCGRFASLIWLAA